MSNFHLYNDKNKLHNFYEMLCTRQTCLVVFFSFSSLKQQSAAKHVTPFSILFWNNQSLLNLLNVLKQPVSAQSPECCMFWNNQSLLNLLNSSCSETTSLCSISWMLHAQRKSNKYQFFGLTRPCFKHTCNNDLWSTALEMITITPSMWFIPVGTCVYLMLIHVI